MTKQQILENLSYKKLYVNGEGDNVMDFLKKLTDNKIKEDEALYVTRPFFYFRDLTAKTPEVDFGWDMSFYFSCAMEEISIAEVLKMINEYDDSAFKPFDRVLVRDFDTQTWHADIYSHRNNATCHHECAGGGWMQCIPYEGNESKLGTV